MVEEIFASPAQVEKYLDVKRRRLLLWAELGLLGDKFALY